LRWASQRSTTCPTDLPYFVAIAVSARFEQIVSTLLKAYPCLGLNAIARHERNVFFLPLPALAGLMASGSPAEFRLEASASCQRKQSGKLPIAQYSM
jgi:hypothetical protein